jgi:hypothetical protein
MSPFYPCGGCGKKGAYLLHTVVSSGTIISVQCRYCHACRSNFAWDWGGKTAADMALTLTPGPKLGEHFTPLYQSRPWPN